MSRIPPLAHRTRPEDGWLGRKIGDLVERPPAEVALAMTSDLSRGLTAAEASARLAVAGPNEPVPVNGPSWLATLARQFASKLIVLLMLATALSALLGEWLNAIAIGITVAISGAFGFLNEYRSEREIAALRRLAARRAEVVRDDLHEDVLATEVVPGDLIVVAEGDVVPADARIVEARGLLVNESTLTGEPVAAEKQIAAAVAPGDPTAPTAVYAGTTVVAGSGLAIVAATAADTVLGGLFAAVRETGRRPTVLEQRLDQLGNRLVLLFLALCAALAALGLAQGRELRLVVNMAISLAVGAIPEGLPAVATASLAIAVRRLARRRVLVRRLDAVEALGSTTVIVADKTGTLTENRMSVRRVLLADAREFRVTVRTADGNAETTIDPSDRLLVSPADDAAVRRVLFVAALCNDAVVEYDAEQGWHMHGDPSEGAIVLAVEGLGAETAALLAQHPRTATEPFSSASGMMRTTHRTPDGGTLVAMKGSFERMAELDPRVLPALTAAVHAAADAGYRVFSVAESDERGPVRLTGAVVLEDPLRLDAAESVSACRDAGIRFILATGDHLATAMNVARDTGILAGAGGAVRGADLDRSRLDGVSVVARATYAQKEMIIKALQEQGETVAMTGDGVNDAAALRSADVGVAIGPRASDVAVESADIVLADGRLLSLVDGVREGREIVRNLRGAIVYLLTASFGTISLIALAMAANRHLPLSPLQILWLNLVVHIFPALALATSQEARAGSSQPERSLLAGVQWAEIAWRSFTVAAAGLAALLVGDAVGESIGHRQTVVFLALAVSLVGQVFLVDVRGRTALAIRARRQALWIAVAISMLFLLAAVYVPGLRGALALESGDPLDWAIALACAAGAWLAGQLRRSEQGAATPSS